MPIYEYACSACGRRIDVVHGIHAEGPSMCEACGGAMKKALTTPAIHFKGSGWAKKDARAAATPVTPAAAETKEAAPVSGDTSQSGESAAGAPAASGETAAPAAAPPPAPAASAPATSTTGS